MVSPATFETRPIGETRQAQVSGTKPELAKKVWKSFVQRAKQNFSVTVVDGNTTYRFQNGEYFVDTHQIGQDEHKTNPPDKIRSVFEDTLNLSACYIISRELHSARTELETATGSQRIESLKGTIALYEKLLKAMHYPAENTVFSSSSSRRFQTALQRTLPAGIGQGITFHGNGDLSVFLAVQQTAPPTDARSVFPQVENPLSFRMANQAVLDAIDNCEVEAYEDLRYHKVLDAETGEHIGYAQRMGGYYPFFGMDMETYAGAYTGGIPGEYPIYAGGADSETPIGTLDIQQDYDIWYDLDGEASVMVDMSSAVYYNEEYGELVEFSPDILSRLSWRQVEEKCYGDVDTN